MHPILWTIVARAASRHHAGVPARMERMLYPLSVLLVSSACVTHAPAPRRLRSPALVLVALALDGVGGAGRRAFREALAAVLAEHNLSPTWVDPDDGRAGGGPAEATEVRLHRLQAHAAAMGVPQVLLVEVQPSYYAQMDGRYRWTVAARVVVRGAGVEAPSAEETFSVPVFLRFDHEREEAALAAARRRLLRRVRRAVDTYLGMRREG